MALAARLPSPWTVSMMSIRSLLACVATSAIGLSALQEPATSRPSDNRPASAPAPRSVRENPDVKRDVKIDYDIVYVRAPRAGDDRQILWSDVFAPYQAEPGSELVLLHPDGREEVLVAVKEDAVADPAVSLDGEWVFYSLFHYESPTASGLLRSKSADLYKIHLPTRKIVRLTQQEYTPNTGVASPAVPRPGVYNLGACPLPGGRLAFTSTRNGLVASKNYKGFSAYEAFAQGDYKVSQLFVMDEDGANVEQIGYFNLNGALDPVLLDDGRIAFASFESQGARDPRSWSILTIHPDGTMWQPLVSALGTYNGSQRHFVAQRSNGRIVFEQYYFQQNHGFGTLYEVAPSAPPGKPYFGSSDPTDPANYEYERNERIPFTPLDMRSLTPFAHASNKPAARANPKDPASPYLGKVTHPAAAPDNHVLLVWSPGPVYGILPRGIHVFAAPAIDAGIYVMAGDAAVDDPSQFFLVKNDPRYNEKQPKAVVPYARIHGREPAPLTPLANDGKRSPRLPAGTPFALLGSSSLYKRESYPRGRVPEGKVTSAFSGGDDPALHLGPLAGLGTNWMSQGAETSKYDNAEIHALRFLAFEPTTDPVLAGRTVRRFWNLGNERYRILGEVPVRKLDASQDKATEPLDPDGNPDTSFLVKLPADVPWTIQTIDRDGMVLNMAQTWHMLRPGEVRTNCGGCHAHSQVPTDFDATAAAKPDYKIFDLTRSTPLVTSRDRDESGRAWDADRATGIRNASSPTTVEYLRDVKPILQRSCVACHTKTWEKPAGNLVLDDDDELREAQGGRWLDLLGDKPPAKLPGTYLRLAADSGGQFGHASGLGTKVGNFWGYFQGSRYVRHMQSRRSLLAWKIHGRRLDGFKNEDFYFFAEPGNLDSLTWQGKPVAYDADLFRKEGNKVSVAYTGSEMPPRKALDGTYVAPNGSRIRVPPLTDEDRRTIVRWIDLGCPIDLAGVKVVPPGEDAISNDGGWFDDENRPTVSVVVLSSPGDGAVERIAVGLYDGESGLDLAGLRITADVELNGVAAGRNLASLFRETDSVWTLDKPRLGGAQVVRGVVRAAGGDEARAVDASTGSRGSLTVRVRDRAGNETVRTREIAPRR